VRKIPIFLLLILISLSFISIFSLHFTSTNTLLVKKQLIYILLGFITLYVMLLFDFRSLKYFIWTIYFTGIAALIAVVLVGKGAYGAQRWISLKIFTIQPSEFEKIILILCLSYILSRDQSDIKKFILSTASFLLPAFFILQQPDLGTTIVILIIYFTLLLFSLDLKYFFSIATFSVISIPFFFELLKPYQRERIITFLNPQMDPLGSGYNVIQSIIAIGSGKISGKWFGSTQTSLHFVPVQYADFIFSAIGEMGGFIGASILLLLYIALFLFMIKAYKSVNNLFGKYIIVGIFIMFITQIFINIGMCIGITPVTGIPLPFISFGGSSTLVNFIAIGLVLNIYVYREDMNISI